MDNENIHESTVFVKIEEYKEVITLFDQLRTKLGKAKETLGKVMELKKEEQTEIDLWSNSVAEIENKLAFIDKRLRGNE